MSPRLPRAIRRLTHPRSRRSQLWACVYCGAFRRAEPAAFDESDAADSVD